jgi:hypothetical protein
MNSAYYFPKLLDLVRSKSIKLYLGPCKVIMTLQGVFMVVNPVYQQGYYGRFTGDADGRFNPSRQCTQEHIDLLTKVEEGGLQAVAEIGLLTGNCCVCGRMLTAEDSIAGGIGPICAGKVGYAYGGEL